MQISGWKKILTYFVVGLATLLILLSFLGFIFRNQNSSPKAKITFSVNIPSNTPDSDTVHIFFPGGVHYKMNKVSDYKYEITLKREDIQPDEEDIVRYRYSRNGSDFATAEYLEPDTNDFFWTQLGRQTLFAKDKIQNDTVKRWRWFPVDTEAIENKSNLEPIGTFLPRINNIAFSSGQVIEDLYTPAFDDFFETTASHMKVVGYNWVEIAPPWQWTEKDGFPVVENQYKTSPNYPNDEKLEQEIKALKNAGMKVTLAPQICCTELSTDNRSEEWWQKYFEETTKFLVHFADVAERSGVDSIQYSIGSWDVQRKEDWPKVFAEIRKHFSGKVGQSLWSFGENIGQIIPNAGEIPWGNQVDFFHVAIDAPISYEDNPTDEELKQGADRVLDGTKQLYDAFGKPVFIQTTYFNVQQTWRGTSFYQISDVPWQGSEENELADGKYKLSLTDQARVVNAYFRSISERPWIVGYSQFGYGHWENPLSSELSVRGKQAEDIWGKWNKVVGTAAKNT